MVNAQSECFLGMKKKVVIITGASSGIGFELALEFGRNKYKVWATSRNPGKFGNLRKSAKKEKISIEFLKIDLNNRKSIDRAIKKILKKEKRVDVLVNNAGYGLIGSVEDTPIEDLISLFETNFFGAYYITQQLLPWMRKRKRGTIVNIGSMAGIYAFAGLSGYSATKWAMEAFSESLYLETKQFGIRVMLVTPGRVKTHFKKNSVEIWKQLKNTAYKSVYLKYKKRRFGYLVMSPQKLARLTVESVEEENPPLRQTVGLEAWIMQKARNWLPEKVILWLSGL